MKRDGQEVCLKLNVDLVVCLLLVVCCLLLYYFYDTIYNIIYIGKIAFKVAIVEYFFDRFQQNRMISGVVGWRTAEWKRVIASSATAVERHDC